MNLVEVAEESQDPNHVVVHCLRLMVICNKMV